jgi:hypothetical protein
MSLVFQGHTIAPGILAPPELANGFGGLIQPLPIRQQPHEFDRAEKLDSVRVWPAQRLEFSCGDENSDIFRGLGKGFKDKLTRR